MYPKPHNNNQQTPSNPYHFPTTFLPHPYHPITDPTPTTTYQMHTISLPKPYQLLNHFIPTSLPPNILTSSIPNPCQPPPIPCHPHTTYQQNPYPPLRIPYQPHASPIPTPCQAPYQHQPALYHRSPPHRIPTNYIPKSLPGPYMLLTHPLPNPLGSTGFN